jgi:hypothetical protein
MNDREALQHSLALWALEQLPPEQVVALAVEALQDSCENLSVARLAGLRTPARPDIEEELPRILNALHLDRPTQAEALKIVVDEGARQIVAGAIDPIVGAHAMWRHWGGRRDVDPSQFAQLHVFIALGAEAAASSPDPPPADLGPAVIGEAQALLQRGGLPLPETA